MDLKDYVIIISSMATMLGVSIKYIGWIIKSAIKEGLYNHIQQEHKPINTELEKLNIDVARIKVIIKNKETDNHL